MNEGEGHLPLGIRPADWAATPVAMQPWVVSLLETVAVLQKRLGYLVEHLHLPIPHRAQRLDRWQQLLTKGISPLKPGAGPAGPIVTRWRLRLNVALPAIRRPT